MMILAIDPGTTESAYVELTNDGAVVTSGFLANGNLLQLLRGRGGRWASIAVELVECFGMAVGKEVFDTVRFTGRIEEIVSTVQWIPRRAVKLHLCNSMKAKDPNIRQALLDRYGGAMAAKKGGPLYGISKHKWAALACGVTALHELKVGRENGTREMEACRRP